MNLIVIVYFLAYYYIMAEPCARLIANSTYVSYAKKYGIDTKTKTGKPKPMTALAKAIYARETKHLKKGSKGLYYY